MNERAGSRSGIGVRRAFRRARRVDWWIHLIATSGRYNDSLHDIETRWSVRQLTEAHRVLRVWGQLEKQRADKLSKTFNNKGFQS